MKKATIILPTYNERDNIRTLIPILFTIIARCPSSWSVSVLVVDDNSPDGTATEVGRLKKQFKNLHVITGKKAGLGNAYRRGFAYSSETLRADIVFEMDADLSHDPQLIPYFLKAIDNGADFVIGSRYMSGGSIPQNWAFHRKLFSTLGNLVIRFGLMKLHVHDWTSGFRAIKTNFIKETLSYMSQYNGYVFQVALLNKAEDKGLLINEIPLQFKDRSRGKSKINSGQFILATLAYVLTHSSFIKFLVVGTIGFVIDFGLSYVLIELAHGTIWIATLASAETAIVANFLLNNFWSFAEKQVEKSSVAYLRSFIDFNAVSAGSIVIQVLTLHLATTFLTKNLWPIYKALVIIFLIIPYSYFMYNKLIWKKTSRS